MNEHADEPQDIEVSLDNMNKILERNPWNFIVLRTT